MNATFRPRRASFSCSLALSGVSMVVLGAAVAACTSDELLPDRSTRPGAHFDAGRDAPPEEDAAPDALPDNADGADAEQVCTPGLDQTCNDDPAISSLHGRCMASGTCECSGVMGINPASGRCL